jgi:YVTN family beta-propeller protein
MNRLSRASRRRASALFLAATALAAIAAVAPAGAQTASTAPRVVNSAKVGSGLYELVLSEPAETVYVASTGTNDVKLYGLDAKTLAVKGSVDTAAAPAYGLGLNNRTQTVYTSNTRVGSVSAIDLRSGKVLNTITVADSPRAHTYRVLVDEDANMTYVSIAETPGKVWAIDGRTNTLSGVIQNVGSRTTGLALDKAANRLYASSLGTNEIVVVDLKTRQVTATYPSGGTGTTQLAFDPKTRRLFAANQQSGDLSVLDMNTGAVVKTVKTGAGALGVGFNAKTNQIYVANRGAGTVTVIDGASLAVVADLKAGTMPNTVLIDQRSGMVYVTNKARRPGRGDAGAAPVADEGGDTVTVIAP